MDDDARNFKDHCHERVDAALSSDHRLQKAERAIFAMLAPHVTGGALLDIGVASGRTTPALAALSSNYIGIDYSEGMVAICKSRYPTRRFMTMDARDIERFFAHEHFDLIVYAFNGIDGAGHEERLSIMSGIQQALKPGGYFVFSSHNRDFAQFAHLAERRPHVGSIGDLLRLPLRYARYAKDTRRNVIETEYAVVNESSGEYPLPQYYISLDSQVRQLRTLGFDKRIDAYGYDGMLIDRDRKHDRDSAWIYYIARKR
ncbi:hypothetical protein AWB79_05198 [Caballeronia hypogeia]|uniref:Methyltransferase domain-containing protein n=1 Tax=Caballeronia hypogeia TaxID=1777140 RepID=A0A158CDY6_9BURK|nr:class I SAM-dependent methyltransferase [Caballeronia hypogeia]SAK80500.1 hypothetical protein AWB79_05198 [Caballeronia hypogeia]